MSQTCKDMLNNKDNFEEEMKRLFDKIDTNHSSDIDRKEFRVYIQSLYKNSGKKITNEIIDKFIKNYDKDKSGTLDFEEFKEFAIKTLKNYSL
jgi:Ca2+-binding EF-hand superfamily protein